MKGISTKGHYALNAMYLLSRSPHLKSMQVKQLAALMDVSAPYLEQMMSQLKKAKLLSSVRGAQGGFIFAKPPSEIRVIDILLAVEPDLFSVKKSLIANDVLGHFWEEALEKSKAVFELKLSELDTRYQPLMYQI